MNPWAAHGMFLAVGSMTLNRVLSVKEHFGLCHYVGCPRVEVVGLGSPNPLLMPVWSQNGHPSSTGVAVYRRVFLHCRRS